MTTESKNGTFKISIKIYLENTFCGKYINISMRQVIYDKGNLNLSDAINYSSVFWMNYHSC